MRWPLHQDAPDADDFVFAGRVFQLIAKPLEIHIGSQLEPIRRSIDEQVLRHVEPRYAQARRRVHPLFMDAAKALGSAVRERPRRWSSG